MKKVFILSFFCILAATVSFYLVNKQFNPAHSTEDLLKELQTAYTQDSAFIATNLGNIFTDNVSQTLQHSPFGIEVYYDQKIVWWNNVSRYLPLRLEAKDSYFEKDSISIVLKSGLINNQKNIREGDQASWYRQWDIKHSRISSNLSFKGESYFAKKIDDVLLLTLKIVSFIFFYFGLILFCYGIWNSNLVKNIHYKFGVTVFISLLARQLFAASFILETFQSWSVLEMVNDGYWFSNISLVLFDILVFSILILYLNQASFANSLSRVSNRLVLVFSGLFTILVFGYYNVLVKTYIQSKNVNVDIDDILEFNAGSVVLIVSLVLLLVQIFQLLQSVFRIIHERKISFNLKYIYLLLGVIIGVPILHIISIGIPMVVFLIFVISVILIFDAYSDISDKKITYLLWWMMLFSAYLAINIYHFGSIRESESRAYVSTNLLKDPNPTVVSKIAFIQNKLDSSHVFEQIAKLTYPAKWDKNEISELIENEIGTQQLLNDVALFDSNGFSLFANHYGNYHHVRQNLLASAKLNATPILYHPSLDKYFLSFEIFPDSHPFGPWLLVLSLEDPQRLNYSENFENTHYAIIKNGEILEKKGSGMNFPDDYTLLQIKESGKINDFVFSLGQNDLGYKIIAYSKKSGLLKPISIFSFIFTVLGIIIILLTLINTRYNFLSDDLPFRLGSRASLKSKIQTAIILLILSSFLIIGAVTAFYFYNLIKATQTAKEKEENHILLQTLKSDIGKLPDDEASLQFIHKSLLALSYTHDKDLQLYSDDGKIIASSLIEPINFKIPYTDWLNQMNKLGLKGYTNIQNNQNLDFIPLYGNGNKPFGYVGIIHRYSDISARSIVDFLSTILNVYIFLFLIAGAIAITIANSITQPLTILAEKLKKFKLGKSNEFLEWKSNDEIGSLITDYNNLNLELTRSAETLAKTERDMAWREMAKQVAHEIKNPLTPMKLSIQYLERTAKDSPQRAHDMIPRVASTLIEQIDNLSQIAVEFSNFAAMPQATNEKVALNELVVTIHDLFRKRDDMDISLSTPIDDLVVFADKNHLVRILNNLVKNAIQAIPEGRRGDIHIALEEEMGEAVVSVQDNGIGIPESMKNKVFAPNFTTKSSGTGLGLAISANMIESFNGRIYFESQENIGTTFFVRIPLMRMEEMNNHNRVVLD